MGCAFEMMSWVDHQTMNIGRNSDPGIKPCKKAGRSKRNGVAAKPCAHSSRTRQSGRMAIQRKYGVSHSGSAQGE
jgi:hypothetical protein